MKLSIITPYYDCLEYIKELGNVLEPQLRDDVEWIIVDDGCCELELDLFDARVIHLSENSGCAGVPRNHGLDIARGEYITFIDAEDLGSDDFVEKILEKIDDGFDYCLMSWKSDNFYIDVSGGRPLWNCSVWGMVYHRDLIGDVRFNEMRVAEDYVFNNEVLKNNAFCRVIPECLYYYRHNEKGIMSNASKNS